MAGTIPVALSQQMDTNGTPLRGCLLYLFQVGSVATPQIAFSDTGLTFPLPWPVLGDSNGRLPMFYLADGAVHARLTDAFGLEQFDYPNMLVIGPSSGSGGGGGPVDPTTVFSTGDIKFRPTAEVLAGWVKLNGLSIGSAASGATQRANADTQALYIYNWNTFPDAKCTVATGRGVSGLADFSANKAMTLLDWRSRVPTGLDDMGNIAANIIQASNVTSGGGDGPTTPAAFGGEANHALVSAENGPHVHTITDPGHIHGISDAAINVAGGPGGFRATAGTAAFSASAITGITINSSGSGTAHNTMSPFALGTFHQKL